VSENGRKGLCHDCGADKGQPHEAGCDVARCLWTGGQRIQCSGNLIAESVRALATDGHDELAADLAHHMGLDDLDHDCGQELWTGEWPGDEDCRRLDFWCFWGPDYGRRGWVRCSSDHPGAREDLNRLAIECEWNRAAQQWELPD
jgi:hypothetical protein